MALPLLPLALRIGAAACAGYAASLWLARRSHAGRTDQRAEDALDDLQDGLALHSPRDLADEARQSNAALRLRRRLRLGGHEWEIDAGLLARLRIRRA
ncbi:hypothetical protein [Pseudogemmobacter sonorensis]|uniref:hypothetical protein n=1 Tax=Pseudogemmobacter sonorensis TaxID=2989681 RepID=UPI0036749786